MKRRQRMILFVGILGVLALSICILIHTRRTDKEVVLEFGMFTGSNWDVESSTSFVIIDKAIERVEEEHPLLQRRAERRLFRVAFQKIAGRRGTGCLYGAFQ